MSFRVQIAVFGAIVFGLALLVISLLLYGLAQVRSVRDRQGRSGDYRSARSTLTTVELAPGIAVRAYVRPWARPDLGLSGYPVVGQATRSQQVSLAGVRGFLCLSGLFTFVAAMIAIWLVAGRALRPLTGLARVVWRPTARRTPCPGHPRAAPLGRTDDCGR